MDWKDGIRPAIRQAYAVVIWLFQEVAARHRSGIYPEALLAVEEYRLIPPGSINLIPVRLSDCEIPPIELTPTRTLQDLHYEDLSRRLARLLQSLAAAKRGRGQAGPDHSRFVWRTLKAGMATKRGGFEDS